MILLYFRGRPWGPGGAPPRFRGRGFGPAGPNGPLMRGRGGPPGQPPFFRGRGGPPGSNGRFGGPNFDPNWGPPPGMINNPYALPPHMNNSNGQYGANQQAELWVETKTDEGKSYYYHALSRETTWTRPEGPHIKIMSQTDVEALTAKNQQQQQQNQQQQQQQQQLNGTEKAEAEDVVMAAAAVNADDQLNGQSVANDNEIPDFTVPSTENNVPVTEQTPNEEKKSNDATTLQQPPQRLPQPTAPQQLVQPIQPQQQIPPPQINQHHPQMQQHYGGPPPQFGGPQYGMPPPGYGGYPPGPWGMPWQQQQQQSQQQQPLVEQPAKNLIVKPGVIEPAVIARAAEWSEHRAPDGRPYYYHTARGESVWEKPQAFRDLEGK